MSEGSSAQEIQPQSRTFRIKENALAALSRLKSRIGRSNPVPIISNPDQVNSPKIALQTGIDENLIEAQSPSEHAMTPAEARAAEMRAARDQFANKQAEKQKPTIGALGEWTLRREEIVGLLKSTQGFTDQQSRTDAEYYRIELDRMDSTRPALLEGVGTRSGNHSLDLYEKLDSLTRRMAISEEYARRSKNPVSGTQKRDEGMSETLKKNAGRDMTDIIAVVPPKDLLEAVNRLRTELSERLAMLYEKTNTPAGVKEVNPMHITDINGQLSYIDHELIPQIRQRESSPKA